MFRSPPIPTLGTYVSNVCFGSKVAGTGLVESERWLLVYKLAGSFSHKRFKLFNVDFKDFGAWPSLVVRRIFICASL